MAARLGFDTEKFDACMFAPETVDHVEGIFKDGSKKRIKETPAFYVDGKKYTLEQLFDLIGQRL